MKIFAQHGFGPKDKIERGLTDGLISGVILSPRYLKRDKMIEQIEKLNPIGGQVLFDPELYASRYISHPSSNLGNLETWDYFRMPRRSALISGMAIPNMIKSAVTAQSELGLTEWIAPNVYIDRADSIETAISLNIISQTKDVAASCGDAPVFATLALSREAVMDRAEFQDIFDALTAIDSPPDGFYILIGSENSRESGDQIRSDLYNPRVIAGWMYMNYVFSINGLRVVNGCCHLLSPLLGICGAEAAANGWFTGLRQFSMNRYVREAGGGRYPVIRYVSMPLMARVKQTDYLDFKAVVPAVANGLSLDASFEDTEPSRTVEALQSWEALSSVCSRCSTGNINADLDTVLTHIENAKRLWMMLQEAGFSQEVEANLERLSAMIEAVGLFKEWAEIV